MKLAVLADIHANHCALDEVIKDMQKSGLEQCIFLGDLVMIGPEPAAVFHRLQELAPICWLKGNTDMWFEEIERGWAPETALERELFAYYLYAKQELTEHEIGFLAGLPAKRRVKYAGWDILCVHGSPRRVTEPMGAWVEEGELAAMIEGVNEQIILCGHSHVPFVGNIKGKLILNAGSVGRSLDGDPRASYGVIDFSNRDTPVLEIRRVRYQMEKVIDLAEKKGLPGLKKYKESILKAKETYLT